MILHVMRRKIAGPIGALVASMCIGGGAVAADISASVTKPKASTSRAAPDSRQMEHDLQRLDWPRFRQVVESVPKLKTDVDAYGPTGWKYVKASYRIYPWRKNIDRLDDGQKRRLAELIRQAYR